MTDDLHTWLSERETIHGKATDIDEWPLSAGDALRTLPKLVRGVRAVLELHKPDTDGTCLECIWGLSDDSFSTELRYETYPCPTVQKLQEAINDDE